MQTLVSSEGADDNGPAAQHRRSEREEESCSWGLKHATENGTCQ